MEMLIDGGGAAFLSEFIDQGTKESHRYYLSRRTVLEMLRDRGYDVPVSEIQLSLHQFRGIYGQSPDTSRLRISASHQSDPSDKGSERKTRYITTRRMEMHFDNDLEARQKECLSSFIDKGSSESHRYFLARRTVLEMLRDRGYSVPYSELEISLPQFRGIYGQSPDASRLCISASHQTNPSKKILVVFWDQGVVKVNQVRSIAGQIANKESLSRLIVVIQDKITDQAMKTWDLFSFKVEIFQITDLLTNITKHKLLPKHRVLADKEKEQLLKKYNVDEKLLPRMKVEDPLARYYGLEKGQIMEFTNNGEITGLRVTYRCVW